MKSRVHRTILVATMVVAAACSGGAAGDAPAVASAGDTSGARELAGGEPRVAAADRGGRAGRGAPSVVLAPADIHTVGRGTIETTMPLTGDLRPAEEILVRARAEGDVLVVLAREGQAVEAGAVLARFETAELDAAFAAAEADLAAARGEAATADWNLEQSRELHRAGAIAEQALRSAEQAALAARARVAAAGARLATADINRRDAQLVAPTAGTISGRFVQTGERVARGAHLFTLVRDDTLEFTAAVPARAAAQVAAGMPVRFSADGRQFSGRIARVSPAVDPTSRSLNVYVLVPNIRRTLKANTFATGRVVAEERRDVLTVPVAAIRRSREGDEPFVYRIEGESIAHVAVRLGTVDDARGLVEVAGGLADDDRVVIGNVGTIGRGMRVQILDADQPAGRGRGGRP
jgi:RND family efflux transporter MFP subunit